MDRQRAIGGQERRQRRADGGMKEEADREGRWNRRCRQAQRIGEGLDLCGVNGEDDRGQRLSPRA
jgi:hypothetical protein